MLIIEIYSVGVRVMLDYPHSSTPERRLSRRQSAGARHSSLVKRLESHGG